MQPEGSVQQNKAAVDSVHWVSRLLFRFVLVGQLIPPLFSQPPKLNISTTGSLSPAINFTSNHLHCTPQSHKCLTSFPHTRLLLSPTMFFKRLSRGSRSNSYVEDEHNDSPRSATHDKFDRYAQDSPRQSASQHNTLSSGNPPQSPTKETQRPESQDKICLLYTSPSPRDRTRSRMPSSA